MHDRVLEAATADPYASPSELAERLSDVSPAVVKRVLAEHNNSDSSTEEYPDPEEISERQIRTLQAIAAHPDATQRDIASFLDVTAATVSNRVNSLPGFEWDKRRQFVKEVLDLDSIPGGDRSSMGDTNAVELSETTQNLVERVDQLERRIDSLAAETADGNGTSLDDPELIRKVVHICMDSEEITDEEEVRILQYLLDR
ncbi:winged helix-turn-helix transcriptional regulator [Natronoarchaeum sp. GCM10025703]